MSNPRMTAAQLREALKGIPGDTFVTVWLPGSRIDLAAVSALTVGKDEVLIEGNLRERLPSREAGEHSMKINQELPDD